MWCCHLSLYVPIIVVLTQTLFSFMHLFNSFHDWCPVVRAGATCLINFLYFSAKSPPFTMKTVSFSFLLLVFASSNIISVHSDWELGTIPDFSFIHSISKEKLKVPQCCPTVFDSMDYSPWGSPGQNTGLGSRSFLQRIFPTQGSNPGLPHYRRILYQLSHKGSPSGHRILSTLPL